ncbi:MAG: NADH-quinone oxidoreductase subunit N [Firmicutes bacterium]|nr:NADH-quinone oxidoreductase subunit N [Bacillota bacterium]
MALPGISDLATLAPWAALAAGALLVIVVDLIVPERHARPWVFATAAAGVLLSGWYAARRLGEAGASAAFAGPAFGGAFLADRLSLVLTVLVLAAALFSVLLAAMDKTRDMSGYLALLLLSALGMTAVAGAGDMTVVFVGLELLSLGLYVLVAFRREDETAREGAFKYFLLGSLAAGILLYGFALLYTVTGDTSLAAVARYARGGAVGPLFHAGFGLVLVGFAFKLAMAPFHPWAPDAYQAAPAPVAAFMAVGTKAAAFVALVRFLWAAVPADPGLASAYMAPVALLAGASMLVGSLGALFQTNVKRLLAYSGIAHAGYLFVPLMSLEPDGLGTAMFYLFAYFFMAVGAFGAVAAAEGRGEPAQLERWQGLYQRHPWLAAAVALFFLGLAGMPPTAGFTGKLLLIGGGLRAGAGWLLAAMVASTGISAYVYLRVISTVYRSGQEPAHSPGALAPMAGGEGPPAAPAVDDENEWETAWARVGTGAVLLLAAAGLVVLGLFPNALLDGLTALLPLR